MGASGVLMSTKRIATIAMFSCLSFVGRILFSFLPNVQPTTAIILIIALHLGAKDGVLVATVSMLISNLYLGMGIWTLSQIATYAIIISAFGILTNNSFRNSTVYLSTLFFLSGIAYGLLISVMQIPIIGRDILIPYYVSGIPYDISHAVGNLLFFLILHPSLEPILSKYRVS